MPEPATLAIVGTVGVVAEPALKGIAALISALKEPIGKRKIEEMRQEFLTSFEGLQRVVAAYEDALETLKKEVELDHAAITNLQNEVAYLRLPFWKRWFAKPVKGAGQA